jgi:Tfp pilus assembly protein PilO
MQNKSHIIILIVSMVFCAVIAGATWFMYAWTEKKYSEIETAQAAWKGEEARRAQIRDLERTLDDLALEQQELERHFSRSADVVPLLDTLERAGTSSGASAEVLSVDRIDEGNSIEIGIRATGTFAAVYKFILLLENAPYELEFTSLDIKRTFSDGEEVKWEGFFKVKILSFLP